MNLLLDTGIIVLYGRNNDDARLVESKYEIFTEENRLFVSVVTLGEVDAIVKKKGLGDPRRLMMQSLIDKMTITGIEYHEMISAYGDLDAYSAGKLTVQVHKNKQSSRNMGKNDLWIAATAKAYNMTLVGCNSDCRASYATF